MECEEEEDRCNKCKLVDPPMGSNTDADNWITCDVCDKWHHNVCVGLNENAKTFVCEFCDVSE